MASSSTSFWDMLTTTTKVAGSPFDSPKPDASKHELDTKLKETKPSYSNTKQYKTALFINECVAKLELDITLRATACWLFHKFCSVVNLDEYDEYVVAMTCVFLAGKIEENHIKIRDIINVAYRSLYPEEPLLQIDSTYSSLVDTLINFELFLCRVLKFKLTVNHPHKATDYMDCGFKELPMVATDPLQDRQTDKYLLHYLKSISDWIGPEVEEHRPYCKLAWSLLNDCYFTPICVEAKPEHLAVTACYVSMKVYDVKIVFEEYAEREWWKVLSDDIRIEDISKLSSEMLQIYR